MEDYLETIAALKKEKGVARVRDISRAIGVKDPSVNSALNFLSKEGLVIHERYGYVDLTSAGEQIARKIQNRHNMLFKFFTKILKVDRKIASEDACKIEHTISPQTFSRLTEFIQFVEAGLDGNRPQWLKSLDHYFKTGKRLKCRMRQVGRRYLKDK